MIAIIFVTMWIPKGNEKLAIDSISEYKHMLKNPDSLKICDDVMYISNGKNELLTCVTINAKNSFGAYAGETSVELFSSNGNLYMALKSGDKGFLNANKLLKKSKKGSVGNGLSLGRISKFKASAIIKLK